MSEVHELRPQKKKNRISLKKDVDNKSKRRN